MVKRTLVLSGGMTTVVSDTPTQLQVLPITTLHLMVLLDSIMDLPHLVLLQVQLYSEILLLVDPYSVLEVQQRQQHSMILRIQHYLISSLLLSSLVIHIDSSGMHLQDQVDYSVSVVELRRLHLTTTKTLVSPSVLLTLAM